jgi:hypothetical protein
MTIGKQEEEQEERRKEKRGKEKQSKLEKIPRDNTFPWR